MQPGYIGSRCKMAILISDVIPTDRPEVLEITLAEDGRKVRLRRDQCEFYPGKVVLERWLGLRITERPKQREGIRDAEIDDL